MGDLYTRLEALRKKALKANIIGGVLIMAGFLSFMIFPLVGFLLFVAGIIFIIFVGSKKQNKYASFYKQNIVRDALNSVFEDVFFDPDSGISEEIIAATGMMYTGDRFSSNDLIRAKFKGIPFTQSDVHIEEEHTDSDGDTTYTTVFRGRWMIFEFNKEFQCDLQVVSSGFSGSRRKGGGLFGLFKDKKEKMERVELENGEFNKTFKVYAQSQHEAFYILTPHIMESLLKLRRSSRAPLMLIFKNGALHVASHTNKDAFEPSVFKKTDLSLGRQSVLGDISVITEFACALRLDNDIYKK